METLFVAGCYYEEELMAKAQFMYLCGAKNKCDKGDGDSNKQEGKF